MATTSRTVNIASKLMLIAALSAFVLAISILSLVIFNESATIRHENIIKSKLSIQSVVTIVEEYKKDNGHYPKELSELTGEYFTSIPLDIWNNPYFYEYLAEKDSYRIYTLGNGKAVGGEKDERDYDNNTNWDLVH